jgi:hypothetical protein
LALSCLLELVAVLRKNHGANVSLKWVVGFRLSGLLTCHALFSGHQCVPRVPASGLVDARGKIDDTHTPVLTNMRVGPLAELEKLVLEPRVVEEPKSDSVLKVLDDMIRGTGRPGLDRSSKPLGEHRNVQVVVVDRARRSETVLERPHQLFLRPLVTQSQHRSR